MTAYQNEAYAKRYLALVKHVDEIERARVPGSHDLAEAVARYYFKLLAIKDEYEVARLYSDGSFAKQIAATFEGDPRLEFHLAPPMLGRKNAQGRGRQIPVLGLGSCRCFVVLPRLKGLRGTAFDIFGYTKERRTERQLIDDYEILIEEILANLCPANHDDRRRARLNSGKNPRLRPCQNAAFESRQGRGAKSLGTVSRGSCTRETRGGIARQFSPKIESVFS